jgi:DNA-binding MarR family transcriptional regulator
MLARALIDSLPRSMRVMRKLSGAGLQGPITFQQLRFLYLVREGMGPTQMAESMQISMAAVSKMLNCLEQKKLIKKVRALDRRALELELTAEGGRILKTVLKHVEARLNLGINRLTLAEKKEFENGMKVLVRLMEMVDV